MNTGRIIAIGDIHGYYDKLLSLLEKLELTGKEEVFFLGDLVDHGPQSADVIEYLLYKRKYYRFHFVMGNHDASFLLYLMGEPTGDWYFHGGEATIQSYGDCEVPYAHRDFLSLMGGPYVREIVTTGVEYIFSHGFLCPTKPIKSRFHRGDALHGRPKSFQLPMGYFPKNHRWEEGQFLVCGHDPHVQPQFYGNKALVLDTSVKYGGPITAGIAPWSKDGIWRFIQS